MLGKNMLSQELSKLTGTLSIQRHSSELCKHLEFIISMTLSWWVCYRGPGSVKIITIPFLLLNLWRTGGPYTFCEFIWSNQRLNVPRKFSWMCLQMRRLHQTWRQPLVLMLVHEFTNQILYFRPSSTELTSLEQITGHFALNQMGNHEYFYPSKFLRRVSHGAVSLLIYLRF